MKASVEAKGIAIEFLIRQRGLSYSEARTRVDSVTPQRVHQLVRLSRGQCSVCLDPLIALRGDRCEACKRKAVAREMRRRGRINDQ